MLTSEDEGTKQPEIEPRVQMSLMVSDRVDSHKFEHQLRYVGRLLHVVVELIPRWFQIRQLVLPATMKFPKRMLMSTIVEK